MANQSGMIERIRWVVAGIRAAADENARVINLTPSETRISPLARLPLGSDFYNRYFFNDRADPDFWEFRGGQQIAGFERDVAIAALCRLARCQFANVRPLSGLSAMALVVSALAGNKGQHVLCLARSSGGHFATASLLRRYGYTPRPLTIEHGRLCLTDTEGILRRGETSLVYLDVQNTLLQPQIALMVDQVRSVNPEVLIHFDASHTLGLILGNVHSNPLECGADSFGGSTHKTFPGPQKGVVFTDSSEIEERLTSAQFDLISSHHFAETISLGLAALEFEVFGAEYASRVLENSVILAAGLHDRGFDVIGVPPRFTDNHQVWVHIGTAAETSRLSTLLYQSGIRVNTQGYMPGLPGPTFRLATNEITHEGATTETIRLLVDVIARVRADGQPIANAGTHVRDSYGHPHFFSQSDVDAFL